MRALAVAVLSLTLGASLGADAPIYSAASIVNAADNQSGTLAPNTIGTIYGQNLAYGTQSLSQDEVQGGVLPTVFPGTGARIIIGSVLANLIYVSPTQINFLVPPNLIPGTVNLNVVVDSWAGPSIAIQIAAASPALFQLDAQNAIATEADGTLITPASPARPGDIVILYATGLGYTAPPVVYSQIPKMAALIVQSATFIVQFNGVPMDPGGIIYAGIAPGFAGLYQINLILPANVGANPQISIGYPDSMSPGGVTLPVQP
ncbi:MAG TPA: IPT/TIG domain-containing protein [Bryobacteraceae bacterium]|nr:IPT/TIG domain-containing protein [Bryobacteraceae bacterium]